MSRHSESLTSDYFDRLYRANSDPWNFEHSEYEADKYAATLASLGERTYRRAFEVGCSIGVLTERLAARCLALEACDISSKAVKAAKKRCSRLSNVQISRRSIPDEWPHGNFELILLSEVVYYFTAEDVKRLADRCRDALLPGGDILLVHWTGPTDYPLDGNEATDLFVRLSDDYLDVTDDRAQPDYRLVKLRKPSQL